MKIWTDGGCRDNGQPNAVGAWAFVDGDGVERSGRLENTTNNRSELQSIIEALRYIRCIGREGEPNTIYSDSMLCVKCGSGVWKRRANLDLWDEFFRLKSSRTRLEWVKGHSGCKENNRADELCTLAMNGDTPEVEHLKAIQQERA